MIPDWQLPTGVDRGLWEYLHNTEMISHYDEQIQHSPLALADSKFCQQWCHPSGRILDVGCGTGRLAQQFAGLGCEYVGVDLSEEMLAVARQNNPNSLCTFRHANLVTLCDTIQDTFDSAICLYSTLGMIRGEPQRENVIRNVAKLLRPGGRFIVHVHNRWFAELGWRRFWSAEHPMPQAHGGAPLTIYHYSRDAIHTLLKQNGFTILYTAALTVDGSQFERLASWKTYGYLIAAERVNTAATISANTID
jgi:SAM-dependent methyltransferase